MQFSFRKKIKSIAIPVVTLIIVSCSGTSSPTYSLEYENKLEPTKGVITDLKEVSKDQFKILNERIVSSPDSSLVITHFMDGKVDTFQLDEIKMSQNTQNNTHRSSGMNSILMHGMMGYWLGRSMSSPLNRSAYMNDAAYNKSTTSTNKSFRSSAKTTRVSRPSRGKSGFGSGRSSRSYGG